MHLQSLHCCLASCARPRKPSSWCALATSQHLWPRSSIKISHDFYRFLVSRSQYISMISQFASKEMAMKKNGTKTFPTWPCERLKITAVTKVWMHLTYCAQTALGSDSGIRRFRRFAFWAMHVPSSDVFWGASCSDIIVELFSSGDGFELNLTFLTSYRIMQLSSWLRVRNRLNLMQVIILIYSYFHVFSFEELEESLRRLYECAHLKLRWSDDHWNLMTVPWLGISTSPVHVRQV